MRTAVRNLIENNDPSRLIHQLTKMFYIMIGLCIALSFALGFDVIQWNTNHDLDRKISKQSITINAIENANHLASLAASKTCVTNLPRTQGLIGGLSTYFEEQQAALKPLLKESQKGTRLYVSRKQNYRNINKIKHILDSYLPIRCPATKNKNKSSG